MDRALAGCSSRRVANSRMRLKRLVRRPATELHAHWTASALFVRVPCQGCTLEPGAVHRKNSLAKTMAAAGPAWEAEEGWGGTPGHHTWLP